MLRLKVTLPRRGLKPGGGGEVEEMDHKTHAKLSNYHNFFFPKVASIGVNIDQHL